MLQEEFDACARESDDQEKFTRQVSQDFHAEHPYAAGLHRGSFFPPPEAGHEDDGGAASDHSSDGEAEGAQEPPSDAGPHVPVATAWPDSPTQAGDPGDGDFSNGPVLRAKVMPDDFRDPRHSLPDGSLKPRRPMPQIKVRDLLAGLARSADGRWVFEGPLNGWPSYAGLELRSLSCRCDTLGFKQVRRLWTAGRDTKLPEPGQIPRRTQATFLLCSWAAVGWAPDSPGFVWWWSDRHSGPPRVLVGESMLRTLRSDPLASASATCVHAIAHRYPVEKETFRDQHTWHTAILFEWSHSQHTTIVELAWKNGVGGYGGKANWCEDKLESTTKLFKAMPESMKSPWNDQECEIRIYDHAARNRAEFEEYLQKYSNTSGLPLAQQRFLDPRVYASGPVRLRSCTPTELAGYMLNYVARQAAYKTLQVNCQTFAADLFAFLVGVKDHKPFGTVVRQGYQQRTHSFLYMPGTLPH